MAILKPQYLFWLGDVVAGLKQGTNALDQQLGAWQTLLKQAPSVKEIKSFNSASDGAKGIAGLVVLSGNHEMLYKPAAVGTTDDDAAEQSEFPRSISDKGNITAQSYYRPICPQGDTWNATSGTCTDPGQTQATCTATVGVWDAVNKVCTIPYYQGAKGPAAVEQGAPITLK